MSYHHKDGAPLVPYIQTHEEKAPGYRYFFVKLDFPKEKLDEIEKEYFQKHLKNSKIPD